MEEIPTINREEILKKAISDSELSDLKQHADKMIRGFENFNNSSSNRAIWELVQNACDLTKNCEIVIDYRGEGLSFTHNGAPFTTKALISLIKQVSGKYGEESEIVEVGKYGTGFLTTHTFGRKFLINSILEENNTFFEIKDFLIDRSPKDWKELSKNIGTQKENAYKIIKEGKIVSKPEIKTIFTFIPETDQEKSYVFESQKDLENYVPIVLTINDRLKKVSIISNDNQVNFEWVSKEKILGNLFKTTILKDIETKIFYFTIDSKDEDEIEIILPINERGKEFELFQFSERVARLFLYYPLIGSEQFGFNFIINCKQFLPTEPRDGIHLKSNKDQVKDQEERNQKILEKASQLIFTFLKSNVIEVDNPLLYAQINFKRTTENILLNEYFEYLQTLWIKEFESLPIVETSNGFKSAKEIDFFDEELLNSSESLDDIYKLASLFYKDTIPTKETFVLWSKFAGEWKNSNIRFITHEKLIKHISNESLSRFDKDCLRNYYRSLIKEGKGSFFSEYPLLPNLEGKFCLLSSLLSPKDLNENLIKIGKILIPHSIERLIHKDFCFDFPFEKFNRKDFSSNIKTGLDDKQVSTSICLPEAINSENYNELPLHEAKKIEFIFFSNLLEYCKFSNSVNSESKPATLTKIISKYYYLDESLIYLPNLELLEDNLDNRSARKILAQIFFNLLQHHNDKWVKDNISLLLEIAECNEDSLKEAYFPSKIYPNQMNQLRSITELKKDIEILPEIKHLYDKVTKSEIEIDLAYQEFNKFIEEDRSITNKYLANQIEDIFFNVEDIHKINDHPFKIDILDIISKLGKKGYADLFPRLDDKKAHLMLEIVTNENTKDDIFSIVTLKETQLKKLGGLIKEDGFEEILNEATSLIQQKTEEKVDFQHKYDIGTYIEGLIRQKLSKELRERILFSKPESIDTKNIQGGQDIIILFDEKPFYFVEVKSRWDSRNSVSMSKLQLQRAVEENEQYALCVVDITNYQGINNKYRLSADEILPLTKFVTNIGKSIKPLIEQNLAAEKNQTELIHLMDYRGIIPQNIIKKGYDFQKFLESLVAIINSRI